MLESMTVDPTTGRTTARYRDTLAAEDLLSFRSALMSHADFAPHFDHLADLTLVEHVELASQDLANLAKSSPFGPGARVALVAPVDVVFGLAHVFQASAGPASAEIRVFREMSEAREWLGFPEV